MGCCYLGDHIDIITCNIEEPQQRNRNKRTASELSVIESLILKIHSYLIFPCDMNGSCNICLMSDSGTKELILPADILHPSFCNPV